MNMTSRVCPREKCLANKCVLFDCRPVYLVIISELGLVKTIFVPSAVAKGTRPMGRVLRSRV